MQPDLQCSYLHGASSIVMGCSVLVYHEIWTTGVSKDDGYAGISKIFLLILVSIGIKDGTKGKFVNTKWECIDE